MTSLTRKIADLFNSGKIDSSLAIAILALIISLVLFLTLIRSASSVNQSVQID
ncbi:MAG: hypothetical protein ACFCU7_15465 [Pleurocapsa sp.]